jgi:predicted regulator of Ras-like GTPase activity (Roadblock/LC7/MglB family)
MPPGAASWTFTDDDPQAITATLQRFLRESHAHCALLVDRAGQLVTTVGEAPSGAGFDVTAFASLTAADFSANDQLARLLGERDFSTLFHQGERESMFLADVARRVILVVLFDTRTTLGLVRLKLRAAVGELAERFEAVFARGAAAPGASAYDGPAFLAPDPPGAGTPPAGGHSLAGPALPAPGDLLAGAEDEIDRLFA